MKKLNFVYEVDYSFSQPVFDHCYALRILPETNEEQGIYASEYKISGGYSPSGKDEPEGFSMVQSEGQGSLTVRDGFGNRLVAGQFREPHDRFSFCVTGTAYTDRSTICRREENPAPMYRFSTDLTRPGEKILEFRRKHLAEVEEAGAAAADLPGGVNRGRAGAWMRLLAEAFTYSQGITGIHTTAEEAMAGGVGVCQDYAHILIALLRLDSIPACYVAGMMIGEGATHAWCDAWCDGFWIGLDPTHDRELNEDYIEVARGRDYRDCIMDRGCFKGYALQTQKVIVRVSELEAASVGRLRIL